MWNFLRYITNNEVQSRHEEIFDEIFRIRDTLALIVGIGIFLAKHYPEWIAFLVIEYCWATDNLRHNRPSRAARNAYCAKRTGAAGNHP